MPAEKIETNPGLFALEIEEASPDSSIQVHLGDVDEEALAEIHRRLGRDLGAAFGDDVEFQIIWRERSYRIAILDRGERDPEEFLSGCLSAIAAAAVGGLAKGRVPSWARIEYGGGAPLPPEGLLCMRLGAEDYAYCGPPHAFSAEYSRKIQEDMAARYGPAISGPGGLDEARSLVFLAAIKALAKKLEDAKKAQSLRKEAQDLDLGSLF